MMRITRSRLLILLVLALNAAAAIAADPFASSLSPNACSKSDVNGYQKDQDEAAGRTEKSVAMAQKEATPAKSLDGELSQLAQSAETALAQVAATNPALAAQMKSSLAHAMVKMKKAILTLQAGLQHVQSSGQSYLNAYGAGLSGRAVSGAQHAMARVADKGAQADAKSASKLQSALQTIDAVQVQAPPQVLQQILEFKAKLKQSLQSAKGIADDGKKALEDAGTAHARMADCADKLENKTRKCPDSAPDLSDLRQTYYGPGEGEYKETVGTHDNKLVPGDVALSPNVIKNLGPLVKFGSLIKYHGKCYRVSDITNARIKNVIDIWH